MERVLVCGDRNWTDPIIIMNELIKIMGNQGIEVVIEGEQNGADILGKQAAERLGLTVLPFKANWRKYGLAAGPIRNQQMLKEGRPTLVLAFHPYLPGSKGTKHMVDIAMKAGIPVKIFDGKKKPLVQIQGEHNG